MICGHARTARKLGLALHNTARPSRRGVDWEMDGIEGQPPRKAAAPVLQYGLGFGEGSLKNVELAELGGRDGTLAERETRRGEKGRS